jgi:FecR-like protein
MNIFMVMEIKAMKTKQIRISTHCFVFSLLWMLNLFINGLNAAPLSDTHWIIKSGDSLYSIARTVYPGNSKQQAKLRKALVQQNPEIFKNGASNISVGDKLKLPDFALPEKTLAPVAITKEAAITTAPEKTTDQLATPDPTNKSQSTSGQLATPDPEDVIGQVIINVGSLSAQNRGASRELKRRSSIYLGDTISTGSRSLTQIRLKDGALLSLRPHTELRMAEYSFNGTQDGSEKSILELLKGGFRTITGIIGHTNKQNYQIRTSVATIGIRGTHYSLVLCQQSSCSDDENGNIEDGLYGGVADGSIVINNQTGTHQFNNDQFFKLTSANSAPVEFLLPPTILKHGAAKLSATNKEVQQTKKAISKRVKSVPRRLAVIFEANQPDFSKRPKTAVGDINTPPVADEPLKAPNGAGMVLSFNQLEPDTTGKTVIGGGAGAVVITPNNTNQIFLGPNRTPVAGSESSKDTQGVLIKRELIVVSPTSGALATLVPSSVGADPTLGVNWGRWNGEFIIREDGVRLDTKENLHYMYSENLTSPAQLANLGGIVATYFDLDGTLATDHLGATSASIPTVSMTADFTQQLVTQYDISTTIGPANAAVFYNASATDVPFADLSRGFSIQSISGGCTTSCTGDASILFVGPNAEGAINAYHIEDINGLNGMSGTSLLTRNTGQ